MAKWLRVQVNLLLSLTSVAYPLGWLCLADHQWLQHLVAIMAGLWAIKAVQAVRFHRFFAMLMASLLALIWLTRTIETMYWYPVIISGAMLALFGGSLFSSQSLLERLARLQEPELPPQAIAYTRKVTQVWCGFFTFNIALCTTLILTKHYYWWALYSGVIAYALMGVLFVGEWLVRRRIRK